MSEQLLESVRPQYPQFEVLGVPLYALQIPDLVVQIERWIASGEGTHNLTFANVHVVMESQHDAYFRRILLDSEVFNVPDGKPLIVMGKDAGFDLPRRVSGPELLTAFCAATAGKGYRHFFYGGKDGVPEKLRDNLIEQFPGLNVAGLYSPPFRKLSAEEDEEIVAMIRRAKPDVLWVGLGCPKQEKWAYEHRERLGVPVIACVGQAFDIHAGTVQQAPRWMRENGLEWFYRLCCDPRRLWRRYLIYNSQFLWQIGLKKLGVQR